MTTTPDSQTVRSLARRFLLDDDLTADELDYVIYGHTGYGVSHEKFQAWRDAVDADVQEATVTKVASWPGEQPQDERDATCAHCRRDLTGASIHTIQGIDVCADIRHCLARQSRFVERIAELDQLKTQREDEQDGTDAPDLYWPFTGALDVCYGNHDNDGDGYRECCMRAGLAYALKLHEQQVRAKVAAEQDGDVRAVATAIDAIDRHDGLDSQFSEHWKWTEVRSLLTERFADRIAVLEARDAKGGGR